MTLILLNTQRPLFTEMSVCLPECFVVCLIMYKTHQHIACITHTNTYTHITQRKKNRFHIFNAAGVATVEFFSFFNSKRGNKGSKKISTQIAGLLLVQSAYQYTMKLPDAYAVNIDHLLLLRFSVQ